MSLCRSAAAPDSAGFGHHRNTACSSLPVTIMMSAGAAIMSSMNTGISMVVVMIKLFFFYCVEKTRVV